MLLSGHIVHRSLGVGVHAMNTCLQSFAMRHGLPAVPTR
jgi:hypothetical protein